MIMLAQDVQVGTVVREGQIGPITVTRKLTGNHYGNPRVFVYGHDEAGRPVELICHAEYEFEV
jgi:hypothetical protein